MSRISLVKEYDNKDVIQQIKSLKDQGEAIGIKADKATADSQLALASIQGAVATANEAKALAKPAKETADKALEEVKVAQSSADTAQSTSDLNARNVTVRTDNVSGTVIITTPKGESKENPIPIASASQTGLMNAQTYAGLTNLQARVASLEGKATTVYVVLPSDSPGQAEITVAFNNAAGRPPVTGDYATDIARALTYGYNGTQWIKVSQDTSIPQFALNEFGLIKGAPTEKDGAVIAEADGTGSVQGWDKVKADISNNASTIASVDGVVQTKQVKLMGNKAVVSPSAWSASKVTLSIPGVTATNIIWVAPEPASQEAYNKGGVIATAQGEGTVELTCKKTPTVEITVNVVVA